MFVRSQQLSACDKYILSYMIGQISAFHLIKIISLWYFVYDFMSLAKISLKRQAKNIFGQSCFRYQLYLQVITQGGGQCTHLDTKHVPGFRLGQEFAHGSLWKAKNSFTKQLLPHVVGQQQLFDLVGQSLELDVLNFLWNTYVLTYHKVRYRIA